MNRNSLIVLALFFVCSTCIAKDMDLAMRGFSLVQYDDAGYKKWKLCGASAEVEGDNVQITNVSALSYGKGYSPIKLKAREGVFDRKKQFVHLEKDVIIKSTNGASLTTDSLDWDAEKKRVWTDERVRIKKQGLEVTGQGAVFDLNKKIVFIRKDVKIVRADSITYSDRAVYMVNRDKLILPRRTRIIIGSQ